MGSDGQRVKVLVLEALLALAPLLADLGQMHSPIPVLVPELLATCGVCATIAARVWLPTCIVKARLTCKCSASSLMRH